MFRKCSGNVYPEKTTATAPDNPGSSSTGMILAAGSSPLHSLKPRFQHFNAASRAVNQRRMFRATPRRRGKNIGETFVAQQIRSGCAS
jgi:hypothetical protein